ncbi:FAD-dependent oxidoreductase [Natronospora cellulosivora (SeqCode)]
MLSYNKKTLVFLRSLFTLILVLSLSFMYSQGIKSAEISEEYYPLAVYGGEPEAVMAAVAAARQGIDTVILIDNEQAGGLMTYGGLNFIDINHGPQGNSINRGLFAEWHKRVGGKVTFSISKATEVFEDMLLAEENLKIYRNVQIIETIPKNKDLKSLIIESEAGRKKIIAEVLIDASQDADLAYLAGVPFFDGGADIGLPDRHMCVTLVMHMDGVNWAKLAQDVRTNKFGPSFMDKGHAWGFVEIGSLYQPVDKNTKMRGLNIVIEEEGDLSEVYINALLIFDVEPTNPDSLALAHQRGQEEAKHVLKFLQENLAGFENASLLAFPDELYVRESRHMISKEQLRVEDVFNNRIPNDTIALASYPLDYQASSPDYKGFVLFNPIVYGLPIGSMIPLGIDNLMVVGRSSGYSSLAAASARVLPTGMSAAEAAGILSAYAIDQQKNISELIDNHEIIEKLQRELGILNDIESYKVWEGALTRNLRYHDKNISEHIEYLLSWGLIIGGYNNDFKLDSSISEKEFAHIIIKGLKQQDSAIFYEWVPGGLETMSTYQDLTRNQAAMLLLVAASQRIADLSQEEIYQKAIDLELIPELIQVKIEEDRILNRSEAYIIISSFLQQNYNSEYLMFYRGEYNG